MCYDLISKLVLIVRLQIRLASTDIDLAFGTGYETEAAFKNTF